MPDVPPEPGRPLPWVVAAVVMLMLGSIALCCFGLSAIVAGYDGFTSWFDPLAAAACGGALLLAALVPLVWRAFGRPPDGD